MAEAFVYYTCGPGRFGVREWSHLDGTPAPGAPSGCTVITQAAYEAGIAAIEAQRVIDQAAVRAAEDMTNRLRAGMPERVVAALGAPAYVRDTAAYVCDGTDDQVQINQAINDTVAAGGGTVLLSSGTFFLQDSVAVPVTKVLTIAGQGQGATVLKNAPATNRYAVVFNGADDTRVTIRDLTVDGSMLDQTTGGGCIWAPGAVQCRFLNLHVTAFYEYGISMRPMTGGAFGHTNYVTNCLFDNSMDSPGSGTGLHFTSNDENFITSCDFEFLGGNGGLASGIYDQSGAQFVTACNFVGGRAGKSSVRVQNAHNTRIVSCNFDGVGGDGVFISGSGCVVDSSTFFGVGIIGAPGLAAGVHLEFASTDNVISANVLATHTVNGAAHSLIREDGDGDAGGNLVTGNQLVQKGTAAFGLLAMNGVGSVIRDNVGAGPIGDESPPVKVVAGPVSDASFPANRPPADGVLAVDSTNSRIYARIGGIWKSAPLT